MDTLTHIALGACIGDALLGKRVGKRAMLFGALAQSIPDIDFISTFWMPTTDSLLAHRGFTHSMLFCSAMTFFFAFVAERTHRPHNISLSRWLIFFGLEMFVHIFLDAFNNYGVGWFEPFSHYRISFNTIYVADPFFSIWPAIALIMLIVLKRRHSKRKLWSMTAIGLSLVYLFYCGINKVKISNELSQAIESKHLPHEKYFTTPTPFNSWLWYVVTGDDNGFYVGFRSVFDKESSIDFRYFPKNKDLLNPLYGTHDLKNLVRFSQQFYTAEKWNDTLVFNDLRFGQVHGWDNPNEKFVFHYFLQGAKDNLLVVQRGRFSGWNRETIKSFIKRIKGI